MKNFKVMFVLTAMLVLALALSGCHGMQKRQQRGMCAKCHAKMSESDAQACAKMKAQGKDCMGAKLCEKCRMKRKANCPKYKKKSDAAMEKACANCKAMVEECPKCKEMGVMCPACMKKQMQCPKCGDKEMMKEAAPAASGTGEPVTSM